MFRLDTFETQFSEVLVNAGSALFASGCIQNLDLTDRPLITARVNGPDQDAVEVEVLLRGGRVATTTCECQGYLDKKSCAHIPGVLFAIRARLLADQKKAKESARIQALPTKLSTRAMLSDVGLEALRNFILYQARRNKVLQIALKTRFIREIELRPPINKYDRLLGELVRIKPDGTVKLSKRDVRLLSEMVHGIFDHFEETLLDKNYRESLDILEALLQKLHLALAKIERHDERLDGLIAETYLKTNQFLDKALPPELTARFLKYLCRLGQKSTYIPVSLKQNVIQSASKIAHTPAQRVELLRIATEKVLKSDHQAIWGALAVRLVSMFDLESNPDAFIPALDDTILIRILKILRETGYDKEVVTFANEIEASQVLTGYFEVTCLKLHFEAAKSLNLTKEILETGIRLLIEVEDPLLLTELKHATKNWPSLSKRLIKTFKKVTPAPKQHRLLALIYSNEDAHTELGELILITRDIDLLFKYGPGLMEADSGRSGAMYWSVVENYVSSHAGKQCVFFVRRLFHHLEQNDLDHLKETLAEKILISFPERKSLKQVLPVS